MKWEDVKMSLKPLIKELELSHEDYVKIYAALSNEKRMEIMLNVYSSIDENNVSRLSLDKLSQKLGISREGARYHLGLLQRHGLLEEKVKMRSKPIRVYRLTMIGAKVMKSINMRLR